MSNFEYLEKRYTDFWNLENYDRPLMCVCAQVETPLPYIMAPDSLLEKWEDLDYILASSVRRIENTYYGGEAVPVFDPNFGPDILGAIAGCEIEYGANTSWAVHNVGDWEQHPALEFDENNRWWKKLEELTKVVAENASGRYLTAITDLHPGTDGLVSLRGPEGLCYDLIDCAEQVHLRISQLFDIYTEVYTRLDAIISAHQKGTINWSTVWHPNKKWYMTSSDFSCMVNSDDFEEFVVPGLTKEHEFLDAAIYHLDGPDALRHLDRILELPGLDGVQWVPGAGQHGALHWIPVYKKIQDAGKIVLASCRADEVGALCAELNPEGVHLFVEGCKKQSDVNDLLKLAERETRARMKAL